MAITIETLVQEDLNVGTGSATVTNPSGGTLTGTQIGIHSFAVGQVKTAATWNPNSIAVGGSEEKDITVSGAALGDFAIASFSLDLQGLTISAYVSATNTVTVTLANLTSAAVDIASGTVRVLVFKSA